MSIYEHPSYAPGAGFRLAPEIENAPTVESIPNPVVTVLATASRACCCVAMPAVIAFIPVGPGRTRVTDLLLCMHHYRASRAKLAACGAKVVDATGAVLAVDSRQ